MSWISVNDITYTSATSNDAAALNLALGAVLVTVGVIIVCIFSK